MYLYYLGKREPMKLCLFSHAGYSPRPRTSSARMKFCTVVGLQVIVLKFEFYQNRLSSFGAVGSRNLPFLIDLAVFPLITDLATSVRMANFDKTAL